MTKCKSVFCDGKFHYYMVNGVKRKRACPYRKKEAQPKKIDVVKEMDRIERRESLEEGKKP